MIYDYCRLNLNVSFALHIGFTAGGYGGHHGGYGILIPYLLGYQ
jgi:hypothetical protein